MSLLRTPLLSFSARGKIAKTLVYSAWKGLNTVRQYVIPANPQTTGQVDQRNAMKAVVAAFRYYFTNAICRTAWNLRAALMPGAQSGFNAYASNAVKIAVSNPDASFADAISAVAGKKSRFAMKNLDDGVAGDEAGTFEYWEGTDKTLLTKISDVAIAAGNVDGVSAQAAGKTIYCAIRKDSQWRSGLAKLLVLA